MPLEFVRITPGDNITVKIIQATRAQGKALAPGDVVTLAASDAMQLIGMGRAERFTPLPEPEPSQAVAEPVDSPEPSVQAEESRKNSKSKK